jgi:acyl-CoA thioesterase I
MLADPAVYLASVTAALQKKWPGNRRVNIICHGHSVPAGYFVTPTIDAFHAYPHLLHQRINTRFPTAVTNVIVTAVGGENAEQGAERFGREVLTHRPDVLTIDYALNDRGLGLERAKAAWERMISEATAQRIPVLLLTPTLDTSDLVELRKHAAQIRALAATHSVGLIDSFAIWEAALASGTKLSALLSQSNHPNAAGHALVADALLRWFP